MSYSVQKRITPREIEVLCWCARGKTSWETGTIMGISERTVSDYILSAQRKLSAANRVHAVCQAIKFGIVKL